jgi:hypothetical protein
MGQAFSGVGEDASAIAEDVARKWGALGYDVDLAEQPGATPPRKVVSYPAYLTGVTKEGFGVVFSVSEDYADFLGYSRCVQTAAERRVGDGLVQ